MLKVNQLIGFGVRRLAIGDADFTAVKILCGFEGADASTSFTDESSVGRALSADGGAQIDTAQFKFGTSSLLCNGTDADVECGSGADLPTATNTTPWTIECFIRFNSTAGDQCICGTANPGVGGYLWRMNAGSLDWFNWASGGATVNFSYATFSPSTGVWYYVCMDFDGTKTRMYTDDGAGNAVMRASLTQVQLMNIAAGESWAIGAQSGGGGRYFNGWIDEYRYTNSIARIGSDGGGLVPIAAFPRS